MLPLPVEEGWGEGIRPHIPVGPCKRSAAGLFFPAQYQTLRQLNGKTLSERTSFVIAPDGKILLSYTDRSPEVGVS